MSLIPVKYPLDPTGAAQSNKVVGETHTLRTARIRPVVLKYGAFFNESIAVRDAATNRVLTKGVDYNGALLYSQPTQQFGKEIYQLIVILDQTCSNSILIDYQALGGEFSYSWDAIMQMIANLGLDNRPVPWDAIIGKPDGFPPGPHLHDVGDTYGYEYIVAALERVAMAITVGSAAFERKFFDYVDSQLTQVHQDVDALAQAQSSAAAIIQSLGYTPVNKAGDTFSGPMTFNGGLTLHSYMKEKVVKITATTNSTTLDLSQGTIFVVTLNASTAILFDITHVNQLQPDESLSFTLILINDSVAGRAVSFQSNVKWADKVIPPRSTSANAQDEFYFSTFDSGVTYTGSLSNENVG